MEEYRFERLTANTLHHLQYLYLHCFKANVSIEYLTEKYATQSFGKDYVGYLAFHNATNKAAAYYGVFPLMCEYNGEKILAAQSGDTMTHPSHQGKKLFITLAKKTYELAKEEGMHFVFGMPNKNSSHGLFVKLSWTHYDTMINYKIKVLTLPLSEAAKRVKIFKHFYKIYQKFILSLYISNKIIPNSLIEPNVGGVVHDTDFFQYKKYNGSMCITIAGVTVWIRNDGFLWVGDMEKFDLKNADEFWKKLRQLAFWLGCIKIFFSTTKGSFVEQVCSRYTSTEGLPVGVLNLSGKYPVENFKYSLADLDTF